MACLSFLIASANTKANSFRFSPRRREQMKSVSGVLETVTGGCMLLLGAHCVVIGDTACLIAVMRFFFPVISLYSM